MGEDGKEWAERVETEGRPLYSEKNDGEVEEAF